MKLTIQIFGSVAVLAGASTLIFSFAAPAGTVSSQLATGASTVLFGASLLVYAAILTELQAINQQLAPMKQLAEKILAQQEDAIDPAIRTFPKTPEGLAAFRRTLGASGFSPNPPPTPWGTERKDRSGYEVIVLPDGEAWTHTDKGWQRFASLRDFQAAVKV